MANEENIEENQGIDFPGQQLDTFKVWSMNKFQNSEMKISSIEYIVVERPKTMPDVDANAI